MNPSKIAGSVVPNPPAVRLTPQPYHTKNDINIGAPRMVSEIADRAFLSARNLDLQPRSHHLLQCDNRINMGCLCPSPTQVCERYWMQFVHPILEPQKGPGSIG